MEVLFKCHLSLSSSYTVSYRYGWLWWFNEVQFSVGGAGSLQAPGKASQLPSLEDRHPVKPLQRAGHTSVEKHL